MNLLEKFQTLAKPIANRQLSHGTLMSYTGAKDAIVAGVAKARITVTIVFEQGTYNFTIFKDSVYGLPNFIPVGGVECAATLKETSADDKEYLNLISLGVKA